MKPIPVLLVTYNRKDYSKQALESILRNPGLPIEVTVFDNGSTDGTVSWLEHLEECTELPETHGFNVAYSKTNLGLAPAMNYFFRKHTDAPYVVKVDNDTVLPDLWLADLMNVMNSPLARHNSIGAVSGTCLRPPGLKADDWYGAMTKVQFHGETLYFNPACLGTGVLINMDMIRERGLLFEKFPRAPGAGPDDPCLISGWGAYIQEATAYSDWRFAMYSKVPVRLLNLKEDQVLSNDYPEYDAEVAKIREEGNAWWESVGGIEGVRKYVQEHGGLESLPDTRFKTAGIELTRGINRTRALLTKTTLQHGQSLERPLRSAIGYAKDKISGVHVSDIGTWPELPPAVWTEASDLKARSTFEFWDVRVKQHGTTASTFLTTPQARINEFTEQHMAILQNYARNKDICEVGCGWGRMSLPLAKLSKSFVGTDFIPELIDKAKESLPDLDFRVAAATALPFEDEQFDLVVAIACLSSFAAILNDVTAELKRVLRPNGYILFLEETYARVDWKLRNA